MNTASAAAAKASIISSNYNIQPPLLSSKCKMSEIEVAGLSKIINLYDKRMLTRHKELHPPGSTAVQPPLHFIGAFDQWDLAFKSIYTFNELSPQQQAKELARKFTPAQNKLFRANRSHLMDNPLPSLEPTTFKLHTTQRQYDMQLKKLVALSLARSRELPPSKVFSSCNISTTNNISITASPLSIKPKAVEIKKKKRISKHGINKELINQQIIGKACPSCGYILNTRVYKKAIKISHTTYDISSCIQCTEGEQQYRNAIQKNNTLQSIYNNQSLSPTTCIDTEMEIRVDVAGFVKQQLGNHASRLLPLMNRGEMVVKVIELKRNITTGREFNDSKASIDGAVWTANINPHPNLISQEEGVDVTVVKLPIRKDCKQSPCDQNFIAINNIQHVDASLDAFCREESISICHGIRSSRAGPASGVCLMTDHSQSHTPVTQKPTSLQLASTSKGCAKKVVYVNHAEQVKVCNFGYKEVAMKRLTKQQKIAQAYRCQHYRAILVKGSIAYITSIACVVSAGIPLTTNDNKHLSNLNAILVANDNQTIEYCLVEWMGTTGEMRNHQALACHTDTNKSHMMEIYSLFHRRGVMKKDGYLYLPLDNACIKIACDANVVVCNLSRTPHVPDQSRSTNNISKVHGPKA